MAMLLALVMVFGMVPANALAAETEEPGAETVETVETTAAPETEEAATEAPETEAPVTEAAETEAVETEAVETEAEETEAVETEPEETEAVETEPEETEAVETEPEETEAVETEPEETEAVELDAAEDAADAAVDSAEALQAALDEAAEKGETSYTLSSDLTISEDFDLEIPEGLTLNLDGATLTIEEDVSMSLYRHVVISDDAVINVYGELIVSYAQGVLDVYGTINDYGSVFLSEESVTTIYSGGALNICECYDDEYGYTSAGNLTVYGKLYIKNNGTLELCEGHSYSISVTETGLLSAEANANVVVADGDYIMVNDPDNIEGIAKGKIGVRAWCETLEEMNASFALLDSGYAHVDVMLQGNVEVADSLTIPAGAWLDFCTVYDYETATENPSVMTVKEGATLTVAGCFWLMDGTTLNVLGDVEIQTDGYFHVESNAAANIEATGKLTNNGDVYIASDGVVTVKGTMNNAGTVHSNGQVDVYGTLTKGAWYINDPVVQEGGTINAVETNQDWLENRLAAEGWVSLEQEVTLERDLVLDGLLEIGYGGHLIVPAGVTLTVGSPVEDEEYGTYYSGGLGILEGGKVDVQKNGKLVNYSGIFQYDCCSDGYLHVAGTYTAKNDGVLCVYANMEKVAEVTGIAKNKQTVQFPAESEAEIQYGLALSGYAMVVVSNYGVTLTEDLTIPAKTVLVTYPGEEGSSFTIPAGKTVTLKGQMSFGIDYSEDGATKVTLVNNGTLTIEKNACLDASCNWQGNAPVNKGGYIFPGAAEMEILGEETLTVTERVSELTLDIAVTTEDNWDGPWETLQMVTWTSSNKNVIDASQIVDNGNGKYTLPILGDGTTKLTATTIDGNKLTDSVTVTVTPVCPTDLAMSVDGQTVTAVEKEMFKDAQVFEIALKAWDSEAEFALKASDVKWTCSDTSLATVEVLDNGNAKVTVKAGQYGIAKLTATMQDELGASASLTLTVKDYTPKLSANKVTLDAMSEDWIYVPLVESNGNAIGEIKTDSEMLTVGYDTEVKALIVRVRDDLSKLPANGTYNTKLTIETIKGEYEEDFTVVIKNVLPSVKVKQNDKPCWNDMYSWTELYLTAKTGEVTAVEVVSDDFQLAYYDEDEPAFGDAPAGGQYLCLEYTEDYIERALSESTPTNPLKPNTSVTLKLTVEGYQYPLEQTVTIKQSAAKTSLVANPSSAAINTAIGEKDEYGRYVVRFDVRTKGNSWAWDLSDGEDNGHAHIWFPEGSTDWAYDEESGQIIAYYETAEKRTETLYVRLPYRLDCTKVTFKVSVSTKAPAMKLGSSTITMNKPTDSYGSTTAVLDQGNVTLASVDFEATGKAAALKEAAKIDLEYVDGEIMAWFADVDDLPANGTYTFIATPKILNNGSFEALKAVKIKVKVADAKPKYKLSATSVKLNTALKEEVELYVDELNQDAWKMMLVGFAGLDAHKSDVEIKYDEDSYGMLTVKRLSNKTGKYTYKLNPIVEGYNGEPVTLTNVTLKLTVEIVKGAVSVKQSAKGKLDGLNAESEIIYTISKLNNANGYVDRVELQGNDAAMFQITGLREDAKGNKIFGLKLAGGEYSTKQTYKVQFKYTLDSGYSFTADASVKVTQGKLKAAAAKMTYYQSQGTLLAKLSLTAPENAKVKSVTLNTAKTSKELLAALNAEHPIGYVGQEGMDAWIKAYIDDPTALTVGKTYKLVLDVTPVGLAKEGSATQVTISVKIAK